MWGRRNSGVALRRVWDRDGGEDGGRVEGRVGRGLGLVRGGWWRGGCEMGALRYGCRCEFQAVFACAAALGCGVRLPP